MSELFFHIDSSQLGSLFESESLGVALHPPKGWTVMGSDSREKLRRQLMAEQNDSEPLAINPVAIFMDTASGALLSVNHLEVMSTDSSAFMSYTQTLENAFPGQSVKKADFSKDGMPFIQYLIQGNKQIAFKLITTTGNKSNLQFDYIIPVHAYVDQIKAIESSIGSIRKTH